MKLTTALPPIPFIHEPPDWGRLPITDNDELLVPVPLTGRLRSHSMYFEMQIPEAQPTITVRTGVLERLRTVIASLPETLSLIVFDGYRPLAVQQWLWDNYLAMIVANEPHLSPEEAERKVRQFVAYPAVDPLRPPPHRTGGAVDVYLVETESGTGIPMGTAPDEIAPESVTHHFEELPEEPFTTNRRVLWHAMTNAGFANYPGEWWHYEYGNQRWANITGAERAIYGLPGEGEIGL